MDLYCELICQTHFHEQRFESRIRLDVLKERIKLYPKQVEIALPIGSIEPSERLIAVASVGMN